MTKLYFLCFVFPNTEITSLICVANLDVWEGHDPPPIGYAIDFKYIIIVTYNLNLWNKNKLLGLKNNFKRKHMK